MEPAEAKREDFIDEKGKVIFKKLKYSLEELNRVYFIFLYYSNLQYHMIISKRQFIQPEIMVIKALIKGLDISITENTANASITSEGWKKISNLILCPDETKRDKIKIMKENIAKSDLNWAPFSYIIKKTKPEKIKRTKSIFKRRGAM